MKRALLALLLVAPASAGWFGEKKEEDPFLAAHRKEADAFRAKPVVHSPAKEGACSACHGAQAKGRALCLSCHASVAAEVSKPSAHAPVKQGECVLCHDPHAGEEPGLLRRAPGALCSECHDSASPALAKAHGGVTRMKESCGVCHAGHASASRALLRLGEHPLFADRSCGRCHAAAAADGTARTVDGLAEACFGCHAKTKAAPGAHPPFAGGDCAACHSPHAGGAPFLNSAPERLCRACHEGILDSGHPVVNHPSFKRGRPDPREPTRPYDCLSCHAAHAAGKTEARPQCMDCHKQ